jgi:hypothetical protein
MIDEKEILEGNKLIAEFMGLKDKIENAQARGGEGYAACRYHESWDWLFGAIDKINAMGKEYSFATFKNYVSLTVEKTVKKMYKDFSFAHAEYITANQTSKQAAFLLLVKFVKWHNENIVKEIEV